MTERNAQAVAPADLSKHAAVRAWSQLRPERVVPEEILLLKRRSRSTTYRLVGVGPQGSAVVAKRCWRETALLERYVYEEVLPRVPVTAPSFYGLVEEGAKYGWLFLEDAGEERYSFWLEEHRRLAARWLGRMHTSAAELASAARLPDRGPDHYLEHLRSARQRIVDGLSHPDLQSDDVVVLVAVVSQCDFLESRWNRVSHWCEQMPHTLVHGDFVGKNVRVRSTPAGTALLPLDWELAGWGVPAADLEGVDPELYSSIVREAWPQLDRERLRQLALYGMIFRWLAAMSWETTKLLYEPERAMVRVRACREGLSKALNNARWNGSWQ